MSKSMVAIVDHLGTPKGEEEENMSPESGRCGSDLSSPLLANELSDKEKMGVDEMLQRFAGEFGRWQWRHFILTNLAWALEAFHAMVMIFADHKPAWRCTAQAGLGCSPHAESVCGFEQGSWEWVGGSGLSTVSEWGLVCGDKYKVGLAQSGFFAGCMVGAGVFGHLSDSFLGRKGSLTLVCAMNLVFGCLTALAPTYWVYVVLRFLTGFSTGGVGLCSFVLATEPVGPSKRGIAGMSTFYFFSGGIAVLAVIAYVFPSWRALYIASSIPSLLFLVAVIPFLSESPRWYLVRGDISNAMKVIWDIANCNGKVLPDNVTLTLDDNSRKCDGPTLQESVSRSIIDVVRSPLTRMRLVLTVAINFLTSVVYYGLSLNVVNLGTNLYLNVALNAIAEMPAFALTAILIDLFGRKPLTIGTMWFSGVFCVLGSILKSAGISKVAQMVCGILGIFGMAGTYNLLFIYVADTDDFQEDYLIYPDMAAYHSIAVTLGQAGQLKELLNIVECMRRKPSKRIRNMRRKNWDRCLEPDVVIFNAVLNACVSCQQWKGVPWVLGQMRHHGLKPNGATYGLAMEVMLKSGKYDLVHKCFGKMMGNGFAPKALTYKVLVRAFWEEGKVCEAIEAVKDMEQRGVVGSAGVYYELACCLCHNGRWQEAMVQVEKLKTLPLTKPLEVAFTGMIKSCMDGGHAYDCISIFESMKDHCTPNVGTINAMLKVYGRIDMFAKAKELFEEIKKTDTPDAYSYTLMLEVSASAHQWEYFEYVYKEMVLSGFQIDQNKHAWVLVEASRAVKWHLLEHAFDAILEAGEIPHLSLFAEMICQNIARQEYERAVSIVNSMGHTSLQMSEKQWTDLFIRNQDRITTQKLMELSDTLCNSNIMKEEAIVSNFLKSLKCLCRLHPSKDSEVTALGDASAEGSGFCQSDGDVDATVGERPQHSLINLATENHRFNRNFVDDDDDDDDDLISGMFPFYNTDNSEDEEDSENRQSQNNVNSDYGSSELPSASEILEAWRESQVKDGIFPFQL